MNEKLEEKFDDMMSLYEKGHRDFQIRQIKSFIDTHFISKEDVPAIMNYPKEPLHTTQQVLDLIGEDIDKSLFEKNGGKFKNSFEAYNQAKQEIRDKLKENENS